MIKKFISFGPNCLAADILKQSGLREATYGFDWFRSGSWHHREFLLNPLEDFLSAYVNRPSIPLYQPQDPLKNKNRTIELKARKMVYGYETLYNPHRHLYRQENRDYFKRCFVRLKNVLTDISSKKIIVMADYVNKPGNSIIRDQEKAMSYISNLLCHQSIDHKLIFIKLKLIEDPQGITSDKLVLNSGKEAKVLTLEINPVIDGKPITRREVFSRMTKHLLE